MKFLIPGLALVALGACTPEEPYHVEYESCSPYGYHDQIGKPRASVEAITFHQPVRIYGPGDAVTADHNPDRINFELDDKGTVAKITCG